MSATPDTGLAQLPQEPQTNVHYGVARFDASVAPTVTDDGTKGYTENSHWYDSTAEKLYVCVNSSPGAAVWKQVSLGAGGGGRSACVLHAFAYTDMVGDDTIKVYSYELPADTLTTNGDTLRIFMFGNAIEDGNTMGATILFDEAPLDSDDWGLSPYGYYKLEVTIVRTSSTSFRWIYRKYIENAYIGTVIGDFSFEFTSFSDPHQIDFWIQSIGGGGQCTAEMALVELIPKV